MPLATTLMGLGIPAEPAVRLGYSEQIPLDGNGTTQGTATLILQHNTNVACGTSVGDTAFRLFEDAEFFIPYFVLNTTPEPALIYPPVGDTIDNLAVNVPITIKEDQSRIFWRVEEGRWVSVMTGQDQTPGIVTAVIAGDGISVDSTNPAQPIITNEGVYEVVAGANITVDNTDPHRPVVNGVPAGVQTIVAGDGISVNATDPQNPIVANTGILSVTAGSNIVITGTAQDPIISSTNPGGTVTAVSVATANGLAGSSSGGTTPQLTLSTTVNSPVLQGNGTAVAAAVAEDARNFLDTGPYVTTRTALKALDTTKETVAWLTEVPRWGQFVWRTGDYSALVTLDTQEGYVIKANAVASTSGAWVRVTDVLSPKMFGAIGDDTTNDDTAVAGWFAVLMATNLDGLVDGRFRLNTAETWDFSSRRVTGLVMQGDGPNNSYFSVVDTTTSPAMYWHANSQALFFCAFRDFGIRTSRAGVGFQIGQDNYADAWNQCIFDGMNVNNAAANANNVSLRLNQVLGTYFNLTANAGGSGRPGQPGAPGYGTAVEFRQVAGCRGAIHAGNSVIGHRYSNGFNYGSTWGATNIEEVTTAIVVDGGTCQHNSYDGGYFVASTALNSTVGSDNALNNPNISFYSGGSLGTNLTGWSLNSIVTGSVLTRSNATGFGIYAGGVTIDPTAHLHQYIDTGTITHRLQSGAASFDISMTASGAFLTNNVTNGAITYSSSGATSHQAFSVNGVEIGRFNSTGLVLTYSLSRGNPVTKTGNFTLAATENNIIVNQAGSTTVTLPAASGFPGREVLFKTIQAQTLVSNASNVIPRVGGGAGTAILPATDGAWALLISNGTNWEIMAGTP